MQVAIPEESLAALHASPEHVPGELLLLAAMKLYELGRISSGAAARLAGISRVEFLHRLADYGVHAFDYTEEELKRDVANADGGR